jgi:hypothetical protein
MVVILLAAIPGYGTGIAALIAARRTGRRQSVALEQLREEMQVLLCQQQTEYRDGIVQMGESVAFLEESSRQSEDLLRNRMTPSLRGKALQMLRSGLSPERAASTLAMPRNEVRLIATVAKFCRLQN